MNEIDRLELILESVQYAQRVQKLGMPASCFTKALREPIFFMWEMREAKSKWAAAQFRSKASIGMKTGKGDIVYDHSIPFAYLQRKLIALIDLTHASLKEVLVQHNFACIITRDEDKKLRDCGLSRKMPDDWDNNDPTARYRVAKIEVEANPLFTRTAS